MSVYPAVWADGEKKHALSVEKAENDSVSAINPETPNLARFWIKFFCSQRGRKRILYEKSLLALSLLLNVKRQAVVICFKFSSDLDMNHAYRSSLSERTCLVLPVR